MTTLPMDLPDVSPRRLALRVTPAAERAIRAGHPWVFAPAVRSLSREGYPGDLAVIFDRKDRFLAVGLYDPQAPIRVRVLQHSHPETIDGPWFARRMEAAIRLRQPLSADATTGYRLIHGENDGLPGLVVDRYADTLVLKLYTAAWIPHLATLIPRLEDLWPHGALVLRLSRNAAGRGRLPEGIHDGQILRGPASTRVVAFQENGLTFEADVLHGQKTGFFLDQRENRARVEALAQGKEVLNVFAYSGGFSLYAARGSATRVVSMDLSQPALDAAVRHFQLNRSHPAVAAADHQTVRGDAFEQMAGLARAGRTFDLVIIDPPAFANQIGQVPGALAANGRLAQLGLALLRAKGILVTASCSGPVTEQAFFAAIHQAARSCGRPLQEMERTGHALDHPIGFPQGAYLKCLFAVAP